jgi:hypothetical protein
MAGLRKFKLYSANLTVLKSVLLEGNRTTALQT